MRSCVCTLVGTKACESCAYNGRNMLIDSIKSVYSPEIKTKSVTTEVKIMDRKKIGTGFEIPEIGTFEVTFVESPDFEELSEEKRKIIEEKMEKAAERLMLLINEDVWCE